MGCFATGVTIITVDLDGEVHGMTASRRAARPVSPLDPLLLLGMRRPQCEHARPPASEKALWDQHSGGAPEADFPSTTLGRTYTHELFFFCSRGGRRGRVLTALGMEPLMLRGAQFRPTWNASF